MTKKLHTKISADHFPELTAKRLKKLQDEEDRALRESGAKIEYEWRESPHTKDVKGKKPIKYLYGKPLRRTPEEEIQRINVRHRKHHKR